MSACAFNHVFVWIAQSLCGFILLVVLSQVLLFPPYDEHSLYLYTYGCIASCNVFSLIGTCLLLLIASLICFLSCSLLANFVVFFPSEKAVITRLTLNDRNTTVTVSGSDQATVGLACEAFGRPRPTHVYFTKRGNDSVAIHTPRFKVGETDEWTTEATLTLSDVQCTDMGTYNCVADNGVDTPDTRSILLEVRCAYIVLLFIVDLCGLNDWSTFYS